MLTSLLHNTEWRYQLHLQGRCQYGTTGRGGPSYADVTYMMEGNPEMKPRDGLNEYIASHKIMWHNLLIPGCNLQLASFPGLHAQLLSLAVRKAGEGLDRFITRCLPLLMSHTVDSHDRSSSNRTRGTNWRELNPGKEEWREENKLRCEQTEHDVSSSTHHVINPSRHSPAFVPQATKAGCGGLGTRLVYNRA